MSHNKTIEERIGVVDALIHEMEKHRDQAMAFHAAADALREMNKQVAVLDSQLCSLDSDTLRERFDAIEENSRAHIEHLSLLEEGNKAQSKRLTAIEERFEVFSGSFEKDIESIKSEVSAKLETSWEAALKSIKELDDSTKSTIEAGRSKTHNFIEEHETTSRELLKQGKDQTIELLKQENQEIKELILAQSLKSQKWAITLLLVGLSATGLAGALLYFYLQLP